MVLLLLCLRVYCSYPWLIRDQSIKERLWSQKCDVEKTLVCTHDWHWHTTYTYMAPVGGKPVSLYSLLLKQGTDSQGPRILIKNHFRIKLSNWIDLIWFNMYQAEKPKNEQIMQRSFKGTRCLATYSMNLSQNSRNLLFRTRSTGFLFIESSNRDFLTSLCCCFVTTFIPHL